VREWPGLFHEIFNEPEQGDVLKVLDDWLASHVPETAQA
jgi:alpha-beta hydrolase superfamily lysophospholipase